jgi:hypothetical protein
MIKATIDIGHRLLLSSPALGWFGGVAAYAAHDAQESSFKRVLKFALKQLLHVSVRSPSSGSVLFELAEVIVIKIIC